MVAMLKALDHATFRSADLSRTLDFYERLLGLQAGPRPPFGVPGLWLYASGQAVLHVLEGRPAGNGPLDHVAFQACRRANVTTAASPDACRRPPGMRCAVRWRRPSVTAVLARDRWRRCVRWAICSRGLSRPGPTTPTNCRIARFCFEIWACGRCVQLLPSSGVWPMLK